MHDNDEEHPVSYYNLSEAVAAVLDVALEDLPALVSEAEHLTVRMNLSLRP